MYFSQCGEDEFLNINYFKNKRNGIYIELGALDIDLLSLDVEGHEYEVLLSWDFSIEIDVILIEMLGGSQVEKEEKCRELLIKNGYKFDTKYKHNEVFINNKFNYKQ